MNKVKEAVDILCEALRSDKELYYVYQANIAMAIHDTFVDEYEWHDLHEKSNDSAQRFLDLLISVGSQ